MNVLLAFVAVAMLAAYLGRRHVDVKSKAFVVLAGVALLANVFDDAIKTLADS